MCLQITEPSHKSIPCRKKITFFLTIQKTGSFFIMFLLASEDESAQSNLRFKKNTQIFKANYCTFFKAICVSVCTGNLPAKATVLLLSSDDQSMREKFAGSDKNLRLHLFLDSTLDSAPTFFWSKDIILMYCFSSVGYALKLSAFMFFVLVFRVSSCLILVFTSEINYLIFDAVLHFVFIFTLLKFFNLY